MKSTRKTAAVPRPTVRDAMQAARDQAPPRQARSPFVRLLREAVSEERLALEEQALLANPQIGVLNGATGRRFYTFDGDYAAAPRESRNVFDLVAVSSLDARATA